MQPRVLILRAPGTNCDEETAYAFRLAGGLPETLHINRWLEAPELTRQFQILCLPGGFSYGDDVAAGRILANQVRLRLADALLEFHQADKLILGICNGFQVLLQCAVSAPPEANSAAASLTWNNNGRFQDRWVRVQTASAKSVFLRGTDAFDLPIAHAEGKFVFADQQVRDSMLEHQQLALRYAGGDGCGISGNPNGSELDVAGVCDASGRVLGLMPHPERFVHRTQHPQWTRLDLPEQGAGLRMFQNAVNYFA